MLKNFIKPELKNYDTGETYEFGTEEYKKAAKEFRRLFLEDLPRYTDLLEKYERFKNSLVDVSKVPSSNNKDINVATGSETNKNILSNSNTSEQSKSMYRFNQLERNANENKKYLKSKSKKNNYSHKSENNNNLQITSSIMKKTNTKKTENKSNSILFFI